MRQVHRGVHVGDVQVIELSTSAARPQSASCIAFRSPVTPVLFRIAPVEVNVAIWFANSRPREVYIVAALSARTTDNQVLKAW